MQEHRYPIAQMEKLRLRELPAHAYIHSYLTVEPRFKYRRDGDWNQEGVRV